MNAQRTPRTWVPALVASLAMLVALVLVQTINHLALSDRMPVFFGSGTAARPMASVLVMIVVLVAVVFGLAVVVMRGARSAMAALLGVWMAAVLGAAAAQIAGYGSHSAGASLGHLLETGVAGGVLWGWIGALVGVALWSRNLPVEVANAPVAAPVVEFQGPGVIGPGGYVLKRKSDYEDHAHMPGEAGSDDRRVSARRQEDRVPVGADAGSREGEKEIWTEERRAAYRLAMAEQPVEDAYADPEWESDHPADTLVDTPESGDETERPAPDEVAAPSWATAWRTEWDTAADAADEHLDGHTDEQTDGAVVPAAEQVLAEADDSDQVAVADADPAEADWTEADAVGAGQVDPGQDGTGQDGTRRDWTSQDWSSQDWTRHDWGRDAAEPAEDRAEPQTDVAPAEAIDAAEHDLAGAADETASAPAWEHDWRSGFDPLFGELPAEHALEDTAVASDEDEVHYLSWIEPKPESEVESVVGSGPDAEVGDDAIADAGDTLAQTIDYLNRAHPLADLPEAGPADEAESAEPQDAAALAPAYSGDDDAHPVEGAGPGQDADRHELAGLTNEAMSWDDESWADLSALDEQAEEDGDGRTEDRAAGGEQYVGRRSAGRYVEEVELMTSSVLSGGGSHRRDR